MKDSPKLTKDDIHVRLPPRLKSNATQEEIVKAINELAVETQLCRVCIQDVGRKLEELSNHIRKALLGG